MKDGFAFPGEESMRDFEVDPAYSKRVAYFCMEYAIHQCLKVYAGGLGFLAGSHMRSAYSLKQNMVGIGILWKYGYYDQTRKADQTMDILFQEKIYGFLKKVDVRLTIIVAGHPVKVAAYYLSPETFNTCPIFFLSTDLPENDYLARTISFRLYDNNPETRMAAAILLADGGAKLLEAIRWQPEIYHLNESHGLPLAFHLLEKYKSIEEVSKRLVFTNHTPEASGNEIADYYLLEKMNFFCGCDPAQVKTLLGISNNKLDLTRTAMALAGHMNTVSKMHNKTIRQIYSNIPQSRDSISITNAQHFSYWADQEMYRCLRANDDNGWIRRKKECKRILFEVIADQTGEIYDPDILTIVFARRFAGYKRAYLLLQDTDRLHRLLTDRKRPIQLVFAGKPHPMDYTAIALFDRIVHTAKTYFNCSVLVSYELHLSKLLKQGADVWLNVPRIGHEASGTSGMSAAMNGALNVSIPDGWIPEFARDGENCFLIPPATHFADDHDQDRQEADALYRLIEKLILPTYYDDPQRWMGMIKNSMSDILPYFDSNRLADEYYRRLYNGDSVPSPTLLNSVKMDNFNA
jgi:starch phosphorylase